MKILFSHYAIIDKEGFGRSFMLARELSLLGHDVTFITSLPSLKFAPGYLAEQREGVKIVAFPDFLPNALLRTGFGCLSLFLKLVFVLGKKFDIVHADNGHRPLGGWPCKFHRFFYKSFYVTEWWDFFGRGGQYDELSPIKKLLKGSYDLASEIPDKRSADAVITLSHRMRKRAINLHLEEKKITVINGGCDVRTIKYFEDFAQRKIFNIPNHDLVFGFIGMNEGEFFDALPFIEAINDLKNSISVKWFTTGRLLSDEIKSKYQIGEELIEFGWIDYNKYSELLSCADVFVLTQQNNLCNQTRWPNKVGDYLAAGRIIITNPVGDITDFTNKYPQSIISCEFSKESIASKMLEINCKRNQILDLGKSNRMIAENEYSWKNKTLQLEQIYQRLLAPSYHDQFTAP